MFWIDTVMIWSGFLEYEIEKKDDHIIVDNMLLHDDVIMKLVLVIK